MELVDQIKEKLKSIVFQLGFIFFLSGNICMLIGGYTHGVIRHGPILESIDMKLGTYAILLIPIGSLMVICSLIGCGASLYGSYRVTICCISFFSFIAIFKLIISCIVLDQYPKSVINKYVNDLQLDQLLNQTEIVDTPDRFKQRENNSDQMYLYLNDVHYIHQQFECCGLEGIQFYIKNQLHVPYSCCIHARNSEEPEFEYLQYYHCAKNETKFEHGCDPVINNILINGKNNVAIYLMLSSFIELIICIYIFLLILTCNKSSTSEQEVIGGAPTSLEK